MDRSRVVEKICKCLRLAESCNANEAAAALRQAQRLMRKYGITEDLVRAAPVAESAVAASERYTPPFWLLALAEVVANAFACRVFVARAFGRRTELRFIGLGAGPEIAGYTFEVLHRHLRRARRRFMEELGEVDEQERVRRGNVFAQAWLFRVARQVARFAGDDEARQAIDSYIKVHYGEVRDLRHDPDEPARTDMDAIQSGLRAAARVRLYRPMRLGGMPALADETA